MKIKNNILTALIMIPTFALSLMGCDSNQSDNGGMPIDLYQNLSTAFKATGNLEMVTKFYEDEEHIVESSKIKANKDTIQVTLTYTNTDKYEGVDYKMHLVSPSGDKYFLGGDNMFNLDGDLYFNSVGYDNEITSDLNATDSNGNVMPYASNASLNPFKIVKNKEFKEVEGGYSLNPVKSDLIFSDLMYSFMFVPLNVSVENLLFKVSNDTLTNIVASTRPNYGVETIDLTNYYTATTYNFDLAVSEIGQAKSWEEVKPEPVKPENKYLKEAMTNLDNCTSYRVARRFSTPLDPSEETVDVYFSGKQQAVYMQVYDSNETSRPTVAGPADALLVDSLHDNDIYLNAYMLQASVKDETKQVFKKTNQLINIDNVMPYSSFVLPKLTSVSENIFNKNKDGSFTPIPEHLSFITNDLFVPFLNTTNEIAGGYVDSFKLYLTFDHKIDRIELDTSIGNIVGHVTLKYDQFNQCEIPFDALHNIEE